MRTIKKKIYFENLDGLRFFCFLSVFFFHNFCSDVLKIKNSQIYHVIKKDIFGNGNLGVNFFFVLSGFLITYLLIEEKKLIGQIDVKKFWLRRVLRIWPLFYLCVTIGFFAFPILKTFFGQQPNENASLGYYLTFTNNFDLIKNGLPDASILGVLWSVAVEEQFYFLWPIILYFIPTKKYWIVFGLVIICSLVFRLFNQSEILYENHTLSCIGDMAIGALGAWLILQRKLFKKRIEELNKLTICAIYFLFIGCYFFKDEIIKQYPFINLFERALIALIILLIILEQSFSKNSFFKMSNLKLISKLGKISYGLYCYHFVGILITTTLSKKLEVNTSIFVVLVFETLIALTITIILSHFSYKYIEMPFLKIKHKLAYITK